MHLQENSTLVIPLRLVDRLRWHELPPLLRDYVTLTQGLRVLQLQYAVGVNAGSWHDVQPEGTFYIGTVATSISARIVYLSDGSDSIRSFSSPPPNDKKRSSPSAGASAPPKRRRIE